MKQMSIPFLDLKRTYEDLKPELDEAVTRVLGSGCYILGDEVAAFESEFAQFCDTKHCVGVSSGLDALHLALRAVGVEAGDEVIVPANTFIATWLAVTQCGATPIPVDPDPATYNITANMIERAISPRTRAIILVHLYGQPADIGPVRDLAQKHGIRLIEDAAQAHGARYRGKRIGAHSDVAAWSFYPGKNLGAFGDAGAVTTDDPAIADRIRILRNYGSEIKYVHQALGFNMRLDPIQAAILRVKLKYLNNWSERRRVIAEIYDAELADAAITRPAVIADAEPSWHLYVIQHDARDALQDALRDVGIGSLIHYPIPPHLQDAYAHMEIERGSFPVSERIAQRVLSLPIGPHMSDADAYVVASAVRRLC